MTFQEVGVHVICLKVTHWRELLDTFAFSANSKETTGLIAKQIASP